MDKADSPRILNVDDDEAGRYAVTRALQRDGYTVLEAGTGEEALRLLSGEPELDLAILDVHLPDMLGFEIARRIKGDPATALVPVILLSATRVDSASVAAGLESGAEVFLHEPLDPPVLLAQVHTLLQAYRARVALRDSEERYRQLFAHMRDGFFLAEPVYDEAGRPSDWRVLDANPAYREHTGLTPERILGRCHREVFPEADPAWAQVIARVAETGTPENREAYSASTGRWYDVRYYSPRPGATAAVFADVTARKQAEEALRESEERLRLAQSAAGMGVWDWDLRTGQVAFSAELDALYGLSPGSIQTREDWQRRVHPDDLARTEAERDEALAADGRFDLEYRILHSSGEVRWLSAKGGAVYGAAGEIVRVLGVNVDITARKRAEEALRAKEAELALMLSATPFLLTRCSRDLRYLFVSRAYAAMIGRTPEQVAGRPILEIMGEQGFATIRPRVEAVLRGETVEYEDEFHFMGAGSHQLHVIYVPDRNEQGEVVGWVASIIDITARKQAEQALREGEEREREQAARWQAMLEAAPGMVWVASDERATWISGTPATYAFLRVPVGTNLSKTGPLSARLAHYRLVQDGKELAPEEMPLQVTARTGRPLREYTVDFAFVDGTVRSVVGNVEPVLDAQGQPAGAIAVFLDITEHLQAEARALAAERARAELAENLSNEIAHRIKNNLAMVSGLLQMQQYSEREEGVVQALQEAVGRVRTFAEVHERMYANHSDVVDLCEVLRQVGASAARTFARHGEVDIEVHGEACRCVSRTATNLSVIANELVTNAVKYGGPGADGRTRVRVELSRSESGMTLSVWNSGAPVPASFDPSRQAGMGLRLVRDLVVAQYGGEFLLRPDRGGTLAEARFPTAGLAEDRRPRLGERPMWEA